MARSTNIHRNILIDACTDIYRNALVDGSMYSLSLSLSPVKIPVRVTGCPGGGGSGCTPRRGGVGTGLVAGCGVVVGTIVGHS